MADRGGYYFSYFPVRLLDAVGKPSHFITVRASIRNFPNKIMTIQSEWLSSQTQMPWQVWLVP